MFLTPVDEIEVSRVVESCKNKLSTDSNGLSMYIVKRIIATIVTPITYIYICNLWSAVEKIDNETTPLLRYQMEPELTTQKIIYRRRRFNLTQVRRKTTVTK